MLGSKRKAQITPPLAAVLSVLTLGAAASAGCGGSKARPMPPPLAKKSDQIKVLTYNVNWGGASMVRAVSILARSRADIVALQETTPAWERFLKPRLERAYPHQRYLTSPGAGGMAFLSKHPLKDFRRIDPPKGGWFPGWSVLAQTPAGHIRVLNVHLRPPLQANGGMSTVASAYFATKPIRKRQLEKYVIQLPKEPDIPLIVMGDFNESESGRALRWAKKRGLENALVKFDSSTPTWRWPTSVYTFTSRLDHILHTKELRCTAAQVLGDGGSDHRPVEAVFTASPKKPPLRNRSSR
jgi:endonuclease/exonuclease/phosphatase family metal-dependent hydrolase